MEESIRTSRISRNHYDYSIYDALEAGFNKVVFVIRKDLKDFDEIIGQRMKRKFMLNMLFRKLITFLKNIRISLQDVQNLGYRTGHSSMSRFS